MSSHMNKLLKKQWYLWKHYRQRANNVADDRDRVVLVDDVVAFVHARVGERSSDECVDEVITPSFEVPLGQIRFRSRGVARE